MHPIFAFLRTESGPCSIRGQTHEMHGTSRAWIRGRRKEQVRQIDKAKVEPGIREDTVSGKQTKDCVWKMVLIGIGVGPSKRILEVVQNTKS